MWAAKYWLRAITCDLALLAAFVLWKGYGNEGAGNVVVAGLWFLTCLAMAVGFTLDRTYFEKNPRPPGFAFYHKATDLIWLVALAYYGMFWLAGFFAVGHILLDVAREREPKTT